MAAPAIAPIGLGMRGTGSWEPGQEIENVRQGLLRLYPNGKLTLTAMLSMLKRSKLNGQRRDWWTKNFPSQAGAITGVYTDVALSSPYVAGVNDAGMELHVKVAEATAKEFRPDHVVEICDEYEVLNNVQAYVTGVYLNGPNSRISVKTIVPTTATTANPAYVPGKTIAVIGSATRQGGVAPDEVNYNPISDYNLPQIFRTPYSWTGTQAVLTNYHTGDPKIEEKREKAEMHGVEIEKALILGVRHTDTSGPEPKHYMGGILDFMRRHDAAQFKNYRTDPDFSGKDWLVGGKAALDSYFEELFTYGGESRLGICGVGYVSAINAIAEAYGTIKLEVRQAAYGISVYEWITPFGVVYLKPHPLFSQRKSMSHSALFLEPENIEEWYVRDTHSRMISKLDEGEEDAERAEWLTETTIELHHPATFQYQQNIGLDNVV